MDKNNLKLAFTMAEALIVMTMLGIIATVMLTTLKPAEFKERGLKIAAKKVLSEIDTATSQILINDAVNGNFEDLNTVDRTETFKTSEYENTEKLGQLYKKYLTATRKECNIEEENVKKDIPEDADTTYFKGSSSLISSGCPCAMVGYSFYLKDGACIGVATGPGDKAPTIFPGEEEITYQSSANGALFFDTNGEEEPNILGKDQFMFLFDKDGIKYAE